MSRPECSCDPYSEDMGGGYYATNLEPDPDCPEHFPKGPPMTTPPLDLTAERLTTLRDIANAASEGPWAWRGNTDTHQLRLTTWAKGIGECTVMDFERWGMQSAGPRFIGADHFMVSGKGLAVYQVARNQGLPDDTPRDHPKVYRADVVDINHPDARHIAAFDPPTVLALLDRLENAESAWTNWQNVGLGMQARAEAAEAKVAAVLELLARWERLQRMLAVAPGASMTPLEDVISDLRGTIAALDGGE